MASEEPAAKKAKVTGWEDHTLNTSEAVMKADEGRHLADIGNDDIRVLQGIGPHHEKALSALNVKTVRELATYKYYLVARALSALAETETEGSRPAGSVMNVDKAVDKEYETKSLKEICEAPISALEGLTEEANELLKELGVETIRDLGRLKYCRWAEAFVLLGDQYEHTKDVTERKVEAEMKKLS